MTMVTRKLGLFACGAALVAGVGVTSSQALGNPPTTNFVKFSRAVALPGTVLNPGGYTFEVVDMPNGVDLIRVSDQQRSRYLGFTIPVDRPKTMDPQTAVTFGEAPAGEPLPITGWYPLGSSIGHQFIR
jgi:hypothetical protein